MPHPVLRRVPRAEMTPRLQGEYDAALKQRDDATMQEVGANAPELMAWYRDEFYGKLFYSGRVDTRSKELLRYRLSMMHGCAFCNKGNRVAANQALGDQPAAAITWHPAEQRRIATSAVVLSSLLQPFPSPSNQSPFSQP